MTTTDTVPSHCVIRDSTGEIVCQRCGDSILLPRVCTETTLRKWLDWFGAKHRDCEEVRHE